MSQHTIQKMNEAYADTDGQDGIKYMLVADGRRSIYIFHDDDDAQEYFAAVMSGKDGAQAIGYEPTRIG